MSDQQGRESARVKRIPCLMTGAFESPAPQMRVYPKSEDTLIRRAELPRAGEHPATRVWHRSNELSDFTLMCPGDEGHRELEHNNYNGRKRD